MTVWSAVFITIVLFVFVKLVCLLDKVGEFDFRGDVDVSWDKTPFWSLFGDGSWVPPVHNVQNTVSHVSQNSNSYQRCECWAILWIIESSYIWFILLKTRNRTQISNLPDCDVLNTLVSPLFSVVPSNLVTDWQETMEEGLEPLREEL